MQRTLIPEISMWSAWQADRGVYFNSYFIEAADGNLLVDPLPLGEEDAAEIEAKGGAAWIVITNRDHERDAAAAAKRFGASVVASDGDAPLLSLTVDRILREGAVFGPFTIIALDGMKSPGEIALRFARGNAVIVGDAVWGSPTGALMLPPKIGDRERAVLSLRKLRVTKPRHLLVGDGAPIFERAYDALNALLQAQDGVLASRVNVDDLHYRFDDDDDPAGYHCGSAEIGYLLGASVMGYRAARVPPGQSFCPLHWHTVDEELFLVWEGTARLRTPHGETRLRRGDLIAFPANERGAHKLTNDGDDDCIVLMIAGNDKPDDVCFYPDSKKMLVSATDTMVRIEPALKYYDGEA